MRRILTTVAALVLLLLCLPAAPANALQSTPAACASKSGFGYNITVCAVYGWRMQNDGTGVHVENVNVYTVQGCGDLEATKFDHEVAHTNNGNVQGFGPQQSCNTTWDLELNGPDTGSAGITSDVDVNVNGGGADFSVRLFCQIKPNNPDVCDGWVA